ncbi:uncharacterized protein LOC143025921 [Oratosquilla oratoria]|uniref:uncharacterized protein LOC143025921 n=1 Tax=Oratosquilla oratoria TaxID=337810 RepID=UPI003F770E1D
MKNKTICRTEPPRAYFGKEKRGRRFMGVVAPHGRISPTPLLRVARALTPRVWTKKSLPFAPVPDIHTSFAPRGGLRESSRTGIPDTIVRLVSFIQSVTPILVTHAETRTHLKHTSLSVALKFVLQCGGFWCLEKISSSKLLLPTPTPPPVSALPPAPPAAAGSSRRPHMSAKEENTGRLRRGATGVVPCHVSLLALQALLLGLAAASSLANEDLDQPTERDNVTKKVYVDVGTTAFLPCSFSSETNASLSVAWIRQNDILTVEERVFTSDERYRLWPSGNFRTLLIDHVSESLAGIYSCVTSTSMGSLVKKTDLRVLQPRATISGGSGGIVIAEGRRLTLECVIDNFVKPPAYVIWNHDGQIVRYDHKRNSMSARKNFNEKEAPEEPSRPPLSSEELSHPAGPQVSSDFAKTASGELIYIDLHNSSLVPPSSSSKAISKLVIEKATLEDSGMYNCSSSHPSTEASVRVHVLPGTDFEYYSDVAEGVVSKDGSSVLQPEAFSLLLITSASAALALSRC